MSDTPDNAVPIGEFVADARRHLEQTLPPLWVGGEIAGFTAAASGHWYFVLRDENGQADCVMLARDNRAVSAAARPKDGDHIALFGRPTLYAPRGRFQLQAKFIRAAGAGRLYAEFVRRKREWAERGWFANARPLPLLPDCVGVVSSLAGAALRDVLRTLGRRAPGVAVVVYPAPAQGEGAAEKIGAAVRIAGRRAECDVLVVCRGGGGMEDLWAYNEEAVVAAVYESPLPVVTGIGHEIDETLADFAADHRAATPTAAAVAAVPDAAELLRQNSERARRLRHLAEGRLDEAGQRLDWAAKLLAPPEHLLAAKRQHLRRLAAELRGAAARRLADGGRELAEKVGGLRPPSVAPQAAAVAEAGGRLRRAAAAALAAKEAAAGGRATALELLSPQNALRRGYSIVRDKTGAVQTDAEKLPREVELVLSRGTAVAAVKERRPPSLFDDDK